MTGADVPGSGPGERRLLGYLEELREDPPASDTTIVRRVNRGARWQRAVRDPLKAVGQLAGALADGVLSLLGSKRRSDR